MQYGICHLSIIPLRNEPQHTSELCSQVLYGDHFKVLEKRKHWSKIRLAYDHFEGWLDNTQYTIIEESTYQSLQKQKPKLSGDLVEFIYDDNNNLLPITLGSNVSAAPYLSGKFDGEVLQGTQPKEGIVGTALNYINTPFLWGGKTPFGIDSSGLTQMVYKLNGYPLLRTATQQSTQGEALSFIEESEAGDLAFFDDEEGNIVHVGIMMPDNYIIHSYGKVRIDRIDHTGIYNTDTRSHSHKLRVIKKII